jgi:transcriptional regulator with PAS, ATPase and Fis domain
MSYQLASREEPAVESRDDAAAADAFRTVVGKSDTLREAVDTALRIARRGSSTVLVVGETGTGKELFARGIHYAGPSPEAPFVAVNCAAIPGTLLESELFGHERGAFTDAKQKKQGLLELARTGTLFLDEVSELPHDLQPKLLRALEERRVRRIGGYDEIEVRCRVVAATNESLEEAVADGRFREDLFYRLNVLRVALPPLRSRQGDVTVLARHFLGGLEEDQGLPPVRLSPDALRALEAHTWPGNVRELKNVLERAALLCDGGVIQPSDLSLGGRRRVPADAVAQATGFIAIPAEGRTLSSVESEAIRLTLCLTGWNRSAAARILDISRPTLARKIELYGLSPDTEHGTVQ